MSIPVDKDDAKQVIGLLKDLIDEVRTLRETFDSFTNSGLPLGATVPTAELVLTAAAAAGMLARDVPTINESDLLARIQSACIIGHNVAVTHDQFIQETQASRLNNLAARQ